ncbi:MAG: response regulator [Thermodesulfobacteriota bacterium]
MKIVFCDQCEGRNLLEEVDLEKLGQGRHRCSICGRAMAETPAEAVVDTTTFKLLFIDDEPGFLQTMDNIMARDYSVSTAADGAAGMKLAKEVQPDLILLDISLPDTDGYELCRTMKLDNETCHIPILFITSHDSDIDEQRGFEVGGMDYITKPISIQVLHARLGLFIKMKQLRS